ncbi:hypothetical protein SASPL_153506 [Salvia splendens]|uniref:AT-hook motif nuclear-localized protein n=1 Tax=Salvia splendens TaxID=180675 RepID=A0A8X8Z200_SALSN|nr:AT-hook motif nuclear-localized protein 5-like isoform X1 [Salvia splendens]KAG6388304.1 hypothetical protein SASPL_153506 [Salvia splendens]
MDGREGMALQGSAPYYLHRGGIGGSGGSGPGHAVHGGGASPAPQPGVMHSSPAFKNLANSSIQMQPNAGSAGASASSSSFHVENPSQNFSRGRSIMVALPGGEPVQKKKRGRPRKYAPDGANTGLGLSPMSAPKPSSSLVVSPAEKARRGRPPGSGWKQKLAPLGEWMNNSAGLAFTPHVLHVGVGEDVAEKILAFAQQRPRALCIMSANGSVSAVTLRQPTTSNSTVTYEGRFEILCLSGSYLVAENGGPRNRTGGISISVCSPDGHIIGGAIGGRLVATNPVQVVACSFVYGGTKLKGKVEPAAEDEKHLPEKPAEKSLTPITAAATQSYTPNTGTTSIWPPVARAEVKNPQTDIDLMRG